MALVARPRLVKKLAESPGRVTLMAAGAGFGKSVAIRQLREASNAPMLHYEVRAEAFVPFVRGLVDAASPFVPALAASYAGAIEMAMQSSKPHDEIALWMLDHLSSATIGAIAIEDLHRVGADERVQRFLVRLVAGSPDRLRWILAARDRRALPEEELAAAGIHASCLREDDLRLTTEEATQIAKSQGTGRREIRTLFELTRGEPAAFHLGVHVFGGDQPTTEPAYDFYAGRYFERCPSNLRELLLGICVFDELDDELVRRSPWASSAHYVASLAEQGLVFAARDHERYRLHEPFRAMLLERLGSEQIRHDAKRAGALMLEARGSAAAALELYLQAEDPANVQRICERHGFDLADQGHLDVLRRALARVSEGEMHKSATLLALKAIAESLAGRTDTAEAWYLHSLKIAEQLALRATIAYRYAIDLIRQGRTESIELMEPYATQTLPNELSAHIHSTLATAYVVASRFDDAREAMQRALQFTAGSDSLSLHAAIAHQAAWVALFSGDIAQAKQRAARAVELALSSGVYDVAARAYSVLYSVAYELEDDARAALKILNAIWDCGLKAGDVRMRLYALVGSFDIAAELGDTETLARMERTLQAHEVDYADPLVSQALLPAEALRVAAAGDFEEAFRLLSPTAERQIGDDRRALRFAEIALYAAAAGHLPEARAAIAQVFVRFDRLEPTMRRTLRTNAILAVALYLAGRRSDAHTRLRDVSSAEHHASLRIRVLTQTLQVLFARWDGAENFTRVLDALQALRASDFGGIAAVLAALPYAVPVNAA